MLEAVSLVARHHHHHLLQRRACVMSVKMVFAHLPSYCSVGESWSL